MKHIITILALFITTCSFSQSFKLDTCGTILVIPEHHLINQTPNPYSNSSIIITEDVIMKNEIQNLKGQVEELKSQVKELSELLITLLKK